MIVSSFAFDRVFPNTRFTLIIVYSVFPNTRFTFIACIGRLDVSQALANNRHVTKLNLRACALGGSRTFSFLSPLLQSPTLRELEMSGKDVWDTVCTSLRQSTSLTSFSTNQLTLVSQKGLTALASNASLTRLSCPFLLHMNERVLPLLRSSSLTELEFCMGEWIREAGVLPPSLTSLNVTVVRTKPATVLNGIVLFICVSLCWCVWSEEFESMLCNGGGGWIHKAGLTPSSLTSVKVTVVDNAGNHAKRSAFAVLLEQSSMSCLARTSNCNTLPGWFCAHFPYVSIHLMCFVL